LDGLQQLMIATSEFLLSRRPEDTMAGLRETCTALAAFSMATPRESS